MRSRFAKWIAAALGLFALAAASFFLVPRLAARVAPRAAAAGPATPKVIVLGFDGMDYGLLTRYLEAGELPAFARLRARGGLIPLLTSIPPQSPVAWSNFITGTNPGGHGIFDFIARDPKTYLPFLSTSVTSQGGRSITIGQWVFPLSGGKVRLERQGRAFWEILGERGITNVVQRIPSNFPPVECRATRSLAGMGTPDILGTYGTFSYFTTEPGQVREQQGGRVYEVEEVNYVVETALPGPSNAFRQGNPPSSAPFTVYLDPQNPVAKIVMDGQEALLRQGEWSDWMRVTYRLAPWQRVHGICRFLLLEVRPELKLYASPVNLDPARPALPISVPADYASELAREIGLYHTQGIAEDTWALDEGRINEEQFLEQAKFVWDERWRMLEYELDHFQEGFLFFYFSNTDLTQHMFWGATDPENPEYTPESAARYGNQIFQAYQDSDRALAYVLDHVGESTVVFAMSDHGFGPFRKNFHLNTWLRREGYLHFLDESRAEGGEFFQGVDWSRTRAYAMGLNGVFVNLRGREGKGIVNPGAEADALIRELAQRLEQVVDPANGERVISKAYIATESYSGPYASLGPDIIPGYGTGYRASWETALGKTTAELITPNKKKWSGDHCADPALFPGILLSNRPLAARQAYLYDLAPTILRLFGIAPSPEMVGQPVLDVGQRAAASTLPEGGG